MHTLLAVLSTSSTRRLSEVGALLGLIGGLAITLAGALRSRRAVALVVGGLLLALCFVLLIVATHFGVSPYRLR
jgi:uncharacterized membrane protein